MILLSPATQPSASYPATAAHPPAKIVPGRQTSPAVVRPAAANTPTTDNAVQAPDSLAALSVQLGRALVARNSDHPLQYSSQQLQALTLEFLLFRHWDYSQYKKLTRDRPPMTARE